MKEKNDSVITPENVEFLSLPFSGKNIEIDPVPIIPQEIPIINEPKMSKCHGFTISNGRKKKCRRRTMDEFCDLHKTCSEIDLDNPSPQFPKETAAALLFDLQMSMSIMADIIRTERVGFLGLRDRFQEKRGEYLTIYEALYQQYGSGIFDYFLNPFVNLGIMIGGDLFIAYKDYQKKVVED